MTLKREFSPSVTLLLRLGIMMIIYSLLRIIFFLCNASYFPNVTISSFVYGLRFDLSALAYLNALYALMVLIPAKFILSKAYRRATDIVFFTFNTVALAFSFIDTAYFPFSLRRATSAMFTIAENTNNMLELIPQFIHDFWPEILLFIAFTFLIFLTIRAVNYSLSHKFDYSSKVSLIKTISGRVILVALFAICCRGGLQLRPINNVTAGHYASIENIPLVLNSPFSIITTIGKTGLEYKNYFTEDEASHYFNPIKEHSVNNLAALPPFQNIVLIILEGISAEYSDYLAQEPKQIAGYTPFIDSLARRSITFRCYANGQQSIVALPAILGGIPSLSEQPFTQSYYATNRIEYPVTLLAEKGYACSFYHGGANGTMGFDKFCSLAGIKEYYGLKEYPNQDDYDGHWGIFDEPYLQYFADELDKKEKPFFACAYTLSSHHPYTIPENYKDSLPQGEFPMQQAVAYADMALKHFFEKVAKTKWYNNTLFVITSDHTNYAGSNHNHSSQLYNIPLLFFHPLNDNPQHFNKTAQQSDIMASVIGVLGIDDPFISYGNNLFDTTQTAFAIHYREPLYELTMGDIHVSYDNDETWTFSPQDISDKEYYQNFIKAYVQQYNNRMIKNNFNINQ